MSEILDKNKLDESLQRHARYQSMMQTATAYGVSKVNTNLQQLQQSTDKQSNILKQQLITQTNIENIQKQTLQISKEQLHELIKQTRMHEAQTRMKM